MTKFIRSLGLASSSRLPFFCFLLFVLLGALLFMRPHQETFIGLDNSAIRMMTHAMAQGRDHVGIDQTLAQVPHELRKHFLYLPDQGQRLTRDRSFQIDDLDGCTYRPWFYPSLSYAALAFGSIVPGQAVDYFLPSLAMLFFILAGWFMLAKTGLSGLLAGLGLLLSLPLLSWFGRGYYPELCGLLLIFITALHWLATNGAYRHFIPASFALGLTICFHPLIALWSGALFLFMAVDDVRKTRTVALALLVFSLGVFPLVLVTRWVTQPYGNMFSYQWLTVVFQTSTIYFVFIIAAFFACCCAVILLLERGRAMLRNLFFSQGLSGHLLRLCLAVIPTILLLCFQKTRAETMIGLSDLWSLLNSPYGLVVGATILASLHPAVCPRPRALLAMTIALASVFLYLKGTEPFGLWSQRRLLPITIPFLVAALGIWRDVFFAWRTMPLKRNFSSAAISLAAGMMIYQNPHFYLLRSDHGSDEIIQEMMHATEGSLTFFDYHQYGSPFAALSQNGALALSKHISFEDREKVLRWAASEARKRPVVWVTAYANPGIEHAILLKEIHRISQTLPRLHAKFVLPAVVRKHHLEMIVLLLSPLDSSQPPPSLDKVFDKGYLALRGPWGRSDIPLTAPDGTELQAIWTKQGSAVIGPVPEPGQSVLVEMTAGASRQGTLNHQVMIISPPWESSPLELHVDNQHTVVHGTLHRPKYAVDAPSHTGEYTLTSRHPYDPVQENIRGFNPDLGVLLHRIRMEVID